RPGMPTPIKHVAPLRKRRATQMAIISEDVNRKSVLLDILAYPSKEFLSVFGDCIPLSVERVVSHVETLSVGGTRAIWHMRNRRDDPCWQHDTVRSGFELLTDLFHRCNHSLRRECRFLLNACNSPEVHVALTIRLLGVNDRDIRTNGAHRHHFSSREGTHDR